MGFREWELILGDQFYLKREIVTGAAQLAGDIVFI